MAILSSTGFYGFLCSCVKEGANYVEHFLSGFDGYGWKIWERDPKNKPGRYCLEIDNLVVRDTMTVFELLIQKIRAVKGALAITQASGKIREVTDKDTFYEVTLEDEMSFVTDDFVRCKIFDGKGARDYHVKIEVDTEHQIIRMPKTEFTCDEQGEVLNPPSTGDEIIQFGNSSKTERQSAIYMHVDESARPAIDVMLGVSSKDWDKCVKLRLGGGIPGEEAEVNGFYCENGMIKATDENGDVIYELSPDGSFSLGRENIKYDPATNKLVFGPEVTLSWDSLSSETQANLKGEPGEPGKDGAEGKSGTDVKYIYRRTKVLENPGRPMTSDYDDYHPPYWEFAPQGVTPEYPFEWVSVGYKRDGHWGDFTYSALWAKLGADGDSPHIIDLTNENASVPYSYEGQLLIQKIPSTKAVVYYGSKVDTGWTFSAVFEGCTGTCVSSTGVVEVTALSADAASVTVKATKTGYSTLTAVYSLSKVKAGKPGADVVLYFIEPSVNVVRKLKGGSYEPAVVSCIQKEQIGNIATITTKKTLKYCLSGGTEMPYTYGEGVSVTGAKWIDFILYDGTTVLDRERVPVIEDGEDGVRFKYIYRRTTVETAPEILESEYEDTDEYIPQNWTEQPQGVTERQPYEWMSVALKKEGHWEKFSSPILWKKYIINYDFLEEWSNEGNKIGDDHIVSPRMFSGTKDPETDKLTGVAIGRDMLTDSYGNKKTGVFGLKDGLPTFELDAQTGMVLARGSIAEVPKVFTPPSVNGTNSNAITLDFSTGFNWSVYSMTSNEVVVFLPVDPQYEGIRCTIINTGYYDSDHMTITGYPVQIKIEGNDGSADTVDKTAIRTNRKPKYRGSNVVIGTLSLDLNGIAKLYSVLDAENKLHWYLMNPGDFYTTSNDVPMQEYQYVAKITSGGDFVIPLRSESV